MISRENVLEENVTLKRFYRSEEEFRRIYEKLKLTTCPHCKGVGTLILHGFLRGYGENEQQGRTVRSRRVFCNNRKARHNGCGRTFSIWLARCVRRLSLGAASLWSFLKRVAEGSDKLAAFRKIDCTLSDSGPYRIWKRFAQAQSRIRTELSSCCQPPSVLSELPAAQVIAHLEAAFPTEDCPVIAFQNQTQTSFF